MGSANNFAAHSQALSAPDVGEHFTVVQCPLGNSNNYLDE